MILPFIIMIFFSFTKSAEDGILAVNSNECETGFYFDKSLGQCYSCWSSMLWCIECTNEKVCLKCQFGYELYQKNNICILSESHRNCEILDEQFKCVKCNYGYQLSLGNCVLSPPTPPCQTNFDCNFCKTDNCTCSSGFTKNSTTTCTPCDIQNCTVCPKQNTCTECSEGFYLNTTNSLKCDKCKFDNCVSCSNDSSCDACVSGYYWNETNKKCEKCLTGCDYCKSLTTCSACRPGFYWDNVSKLCKRCGKGCGKSCGEGCYTCTNKNDCTSCLDRYVFPNKNGECLSCNENCEYCDNPNTCLKCKKNYFLDSNKTCSNCLPDCSVCQNSTSCEECDLGFYWFEKQNKCNCQELCVECKGRYCLRCKPGYYVMSNKCTETCSKLYYPNQKTGQCEKCPKGKRFDPISKTCDTCPPKTELTIDGECKECPPNCLNCSSNYCKKCEVGIPDRFGKCSASNLGSILVLIITILLANI